jgi:hypothetical protein
VLFDYFPIVISATCHYKRVRKSLRFHQRYFKGSFLSNNYGIGLKDRLQKFQNRAARVISGATYDVRSVDLLESLDWKHLELRRNYLKSVFMYKVLNNHMYTAPNLRTSFRLNNECENTYDLRNRETDLSLPKPNTDSGKRCFKYNGAVVSAPSC